MTQIEFEEQLACIQETHPGLSGCVSSEGFEIAGVFVLNHSANNGPLYEEYSIKIIIPPNFPYEFPKVWETSKLIPKGFDHMYPDGHLCLAANCEIASLLDKTPSLYVFIEELVASYLYSATYYARYKVYPFGERKHGNRGIKEAYAERYHCASDDILWSLLGFVAGITTYRGHIPCPCHSGKRLRECHGEYVLNDIRSPRYPLYRDETTLILYDMYKRRKSQNGDKNATKKRI